MNYTVYATLKEDMDGARRGDPVNHPAHYNKGKIEVIEFIEDQNLSYHLGNAIKYLCRAGAKNADTLSEDLNKAVWYIQRHREVEEARREGRTPCRPNEMRKII